MGRLRWLLATALLVSATSAGAQPPQGVIPLRAEMLTRSIDKLPWVIALDQGLFRKHGLEVEFWMPDPEFEGGIKVGFPQPRDPDISVDGGTPMMLSIVTNARAPRRVILASTDCHVRWYIVARRGIRSLEGLKGKRLGVSSPTAMTGFVARLFAQRMGWDHVRDISIMSEAITEDALELGLVDAVVANERVYARVQRLGLPVLADTRQWKEPIAGNSIRVRPEWLKDSRNREAARRFVKASVEGLALFHTNRELALQILSKWHGIKDRAIAEVVYAGGAQMPRKPYPCVEGIKKTMELFDSNEMRKYKPEDFYDDSLLREIDASGFIDALYARPVAR